MPPKGAPASSSSAAAAASSLLTRVDLDKLLQAHLAPINQNMLALAKQVVEGKEMVDKLQKEFVATRTPAKAGRSGAENGAENEDEDEDEAAQRPPESVRL